MLRSLNSMRVNLVRRLGVFGLNLPQLSSSIKNWPRFRRDLAEFRRQQAASAIVFAEAPLCPCLSEKDESSGVPYCDYFHQDLLVARKIYLHKPERHIDIGSRVDGFVAHVAVFREIEIVDIRPLKTHVFNVKVTCADLSAPLPPELIECCDSLSSLHALEHFGLGRYGDPIKYTGYLDGLRNMHQILKPGGKFYFSVPIGPQRVEFNGHRLFNLRYLMKLLEPSYDFDSFSYVNDAGDLLENVDLYAQDMQEAVNRNLGCWFGCAIFELTKR